MNKKTKFKLNETLDKALSPPKKIRNLKALDSLLEQFDDGKDILRPEADQRQTRGRPEADHIHKKLKTVSDIAGKINKGNEKSHSISPQKDYNKRANSLDRDALPAGLFPGASKAIYDCLYIRTIGAIKPNNIIQATRKQLMQWSGIKNIKTINAHIKKLKDFGLVKVTSFVGDQKGSFYEVFLPEDIAILNPDPTQTIATPNQDPKTALDPDQKTVWVGSSKTIEDKVTYEDAKTSLKTKRENDDEKSEIFSNFIKKLDQASKKLTGKGIKKSETEKWDDIAELLVIELELAAARTESVSSVPAFLKEVLRRKLENKPKPAARKSSRKQTSKGVSQSLNVGKPGSIKAEEELWEEESMSAEEKQKTLLILRERVKEGYRELVMSMKPAYTEADWQWLMDNLEEGS